MRSCNRIAALCAGLGAAACGDAGEPSSAYVERDSAGVTIVENTFDRVPTSYVVGAEPMWALGGVSAPEEQQLFRVAGGRLLSDGRRVIANGGTGEIRVYGHDMSLLATHGGRGDGPGEFQTPSLLAVRADSAYVFDQRHRRMSIVHLKDGFARSYDVTWTGEGFPLPRGLLADGSLVVGGGMSFSSAEGFETGVIRAESTFGWIAPDGTTETHVATLPAAEMFAKTDGETFLARGLPFGRYSQAASTSDGVWIGTADSYELALYGPGGTLQRILRMDPPLTAVTSLMVTDFVDESVDDAATEAEADEIRRTFREMPIPDALPPYQQLFVDRLGLLWVGDYLQPSEDDPVWTVFDPIGRAVTRVVTPPRTVLLDVGEDYILGRTPDELDVEVLTLWTLDRG